MKTITYYRTIEAQMIKLLVNAETVEVFERSCGYWVKTSLAQLGFWAMDTPLETRLNDGSFFAMIRKRL